MGIQVRRLYLKNVLIRTEQFLQGAQIIDYTSQGNIILIKTVNKTVLIWFKFHTLAAFECFQNFHHENHYIVPVVTS